MWLLLALSSALASTGISTLLKASHQKIDSAIVSFALAFGAFVFSGIALLVTRDWVHVEFSLVDVTITALVVALLDCIALLIYVQGLRISDISLVSPMTAFTPFFILFVGPLINGQVPSVLGSIGVGMVVIGSYVMAIAKVREGFLEPIKALAGDSGCRLVMLVAIMWSITSSFHSVGIEQSTPLVYAFLKSSFLSLLLFLFFVLRIKEWPTQMSKGWGVLLAIALCSFLADMGMLFAMKMHLVVYVIAIKRTSILFNIIVGALFFREQNILERLVGTALMLVGIYLIASS